MEAHPAGEAGNPLVDMQTMTPVTKLNDPGMGLMDNGRKVLSYAMLKSAFADPDGRDPSRDIEMHLNGHMVKFAWSFDGRKMAEAETIRLNYGRRRRNGLGNEQQMKIGKA